MKIEPIKSDQGYRSALKEVERLMNADRNSPEGDRLDALVAQIEAWERKHFRPDLQR
jgi:HTH-type transcriptional regulator / antitoxin HigA